MLDDSEVELYPPWRQVLVRFREAGFGYGQIVPHTWLYEQFEVEALNDPKIPWDQAQKLRLKLLSQFIPFRDALLEQDQIDLQSEPGLGYALVPPADQSKRALEDTIKGIKKLIRDGTARGTNVNTALLTADQRREHVDNLTRMGMLRGMLRPPRELPPPDEL